MTGKFKSFAFTDCYFTKSKIAAHHAGVNPTALWQVFQKHNSVVCGIGLIEYMFVAAESVWGLPEGTEQHSGDTTLLIKAPFDDFVEYETVYLGILARCSRVATNVRQAVKAARGKPVLFFPGRFDVPETQTYDGYAAFWGGAAGCATLQQTEGFNFARRMMSSSVPDVKPVGTMPHALIAAFGGDTVAAALAFVGSHPPTEDIWALVDFHNDCATTAVEVYKALKQKGFKLAGVRLDTSEKLADVGLLDKAAVWQVDPPCGVNPALVLHVRQQLDLVGAHDVKICVSGGFTPEKIEVFERLKVPADVYAVGEGFLRGSNAYTSDIVGRFENGVLIPSAKVGRGLKTFSAEPVVYKGEGYLEFLKTIPSNAVSA